LPEGQTLGSAARNVLPRRVVEVSRGRIGVCGLDSPPSRVGWRDDCIRPSEVVVGELLATGSRRATSLEGALDGSGRLRMRRATRGARVGVTRGPLGSWESIS